MVGIYVKSKSPTSAGLCVCTEERLGLYLEMDLSEVESSVKVEHNNNKWIGIREMHTLNFMLYAFRFPTHVFWGFKPQMLPETKRIDAKSPSCYRACAVFTSLGVKGTGVNRLKGLILFLLSVSMQGIYIWNRGSTQAHTSNLLWNSLVVYVNYFALELQKWSERVVVGKPEEDKEAELAWKHKSWVAETEKHQETRGRCLAQELLLCRFDPPWQFCHLLLHPPPTRAPLGRAETLSAAPPKLPCA